jgi:membrane-associated protease RseP (regulator of RpoE activity)
METPTSTRRSLFVLFIGIVGFVALLTWWAGYALPLVIFAIVFLVMGHEFGHFITAKRAGMKVTDFFVGFGPVLWSTTIGETRYGVRAILAGGFVKVPGMSWTDTIAPEDEQRTYRSATYPRKALFASAGSLMHVIMALLLAYVSLTLVGLPSSSHVGIQAFSKWQGHAQNAAQMAGLKRGDQIVAINGHAVTSEAQLSKAVSGSSNKTVTLLVDRGGHDLTVRATPVDGRTLTSGGKPIATGDKAHGYLGIEMTELKVKDTWYGAIPSSVTEIGSLIGTAAHAIVHVFSPGEFGSLFHQVASPAAATNPQNQLTRPESIVGVARIAVQSTSSGLGDLLLILMALNIFVGILNMLPILPLDGGYVAIATYERIRSRRGLRYHADVNKMIPFAYAFMTVLLVLFVCTLYLDIAHPIANPFQ